MAAETAFVDSLVADFLRHAIAIYSVIAPVHQDDRLIHCDQVVQQVDGLSSELAALVSDLQHHVALHADAYGSLAWACHKIGKDLSLKLERVKVAYTDAKLINTDDFRALWPLVDIQALGSRLCDLAGRCPDDTISFQ